MTAQPEDLQAMLLRIRYDLTGLQAKVSDALKLLGQLPVRERSAPVKCDVCGVGKPSGDALRDHLENVHGLT